MLLLPVVRLPPSSAEASASGCAYPYIVAPARDATECGIAERGVAAGRVIVKRVIATRDIVIS